MSGRNDLTYKGMKISGAAMKQQLASSTSNGFFLHHGTLLLNVNLANMSKYLTPNKLKLQSKGIESVRARVCNLNDEFPNLSKESIFRSVSR